MLRIIEEELIIIAKIVFAVIEWIRRKPVNRKVEAIIHTVGMLLLFGFVIVLDVLGIFI